MGFRNNHFTEIYSSAEAGSYLRLKDFVCRSTLVLREIKKGKFRVEGGGHRWMQIGEKESVLRCCLITYPSTAPCKGACRAKGS